MSLISWDKVRRLYGYSYPLKNEVVTVLDIIQNRGGEWHIVIPGCEIKLWAKNFAPVKEEFETISFKEVIRKEKPFTCSN